MFRADWGVVCPLRADVVLGAAVQKTVRRVELTPMGISLRKHWQDVVFTLTFTSTLAAYHVNSPQKMKY